MKKSQHLHQLITKGLTLGLILASTDLTAAAKETSDFLKLVAETNGNITTKPMTEDALLLEVNQEGADLYNSLPPEGKTLAVKLAARACNGGNDCRGQNACRSEQNACMGQGSCKGQTICSFSDKNQAVKTAAKLMEEKRKELQKPVEPETKKENTTTESHA